MLLPDWNDERIEEYLRTLDCWNGEIQVEPLVGGLCNRSFVVTDNDERAVARIGTDIPVHGIIQTSVQASMKAAADIGVSPRIRHSEQSLAILDFIPGGCLRPDDIGSPLNMEKIVQVLKNLHGGSESVRGTLTYFWPFQVVRNYVEIGYKYGSRLVDLLPEIVGINNLLESHIENFSPVFTHNDTVPQNFMFDDDQNVWMIDWDYGGYGHPLFDLVGVSCNSDLSEDSESTLFEMYFGKLNENISRQLIAFKLILNLREYMWGMVQEVTSDLDSGNVAASMTELYPDQDPGYEGYTNMNRIRFEKNWNTYSGMFV